MKRSPLPLVSMVLAALAGGCAGPPIPVPIQSEPVCADFELGAARTKMVGSLRFPVRLRVLEKSTVLMKTVLGGKRTAGEPPARSFIPDDNAEFTVEWAQCQNERAPSPTSEEHAKSNTPKLPQAESNAYECGDAVVYKTEKLVTKKGDAASHALTFVPPPKAECWMSDTPPPKAATPPAGAPPEAPHEASDAGDDAGAPSGDSGAPAADAGATGDAKSDAGKDAKSDKGKDAKSDKGKGSPKR